MAFRATRVVSLLVMAAGAGGAALLAAGPAAADGSWSVAPTKLAFGKVVAATAGWVTPPPHLEFTITNPDPKWYVIVELTAPYNSSSPIRLSANPGNSTPDCSTIIDAGATCTQRVIFGPTVPGHFTETFTLKGTIQAGATTTMTVTVTGDAVAPGTTKPAAKAPGTTTGTTTTRRDCPASRFRAPLTSSFDRLTDAVAETRFLDGYRTLVRAARTRPGTTPAVAAALRRIDARLTRLLAAEAARLRTLSARSDDQPSSAVNVAINDQCDKGLKALRDHIAAYVDEAKIKGVAKIHVEQLADNLLILDRLLDPRYADEVKPAEKKKILNDAMVGLVSALGGADKGELTANGKALYDVLSGGLDEKQSSALVRSKLAELAKKAFGKNGGELTGKLVILYDVLAGNLDDAKREEVLKQEVIGLFTRATGKKLLDIPQVQAVIFGYEIAEPFGKTIAEEVKQIKMHSLYLSCVAAHASTDGAGTVTIKDAGGPFESWEVTSYKDPDLGRIVWSVSRPATFLDGALGRKTTYILDPRFPGLVIGSD